MPEDNRCGPPKSIALVTVYVFLLVLNVCVVTRRFVKSFSVKTRIGNNYLIRKTKKIGN